MTGQLLEGFNGRTVIFVKALSQVSGSSCGSELGGDADHDAVPVLARGDHAADVFTFDQPEAVGLAQVPRQRRGGDA